MNYFNLNVIHKTEKHASGMGRKTLKNLLKINKDQQEIKIKLKMTGFGLITRKNAHKVTKNPEKSSQPLEHQI